MNPSTNSLFQSITSFDKVIEDVTRLKEVLLEWVPNRIGEMSLGEVGHRTLFENDSRTQSGATTFHRTQNFLGRKQKQKED